MVRFKKIIKIILLIFIIQAVVGGVAGLFLAYQNGFFEDKPTAEDVSMRIIGFLKNNDSWIAEGKCTIGTVNAFVGDTRKTNTGDPAWPVRVRIYLDCAKAYPCNICPTLKEVDTDPSGVSAVGRLSSGGTRGLAKIHPCEEFLVYKNAFKELKIESLCK